MTHSLVSQNDKDVTEKPKNILNQWLT